MNKETTHVTTEASSSRRLQDIQYELHRLHCVIGLVDASEEIPDAEHGSISLVKTQLGRLIDCVSVLADDIGREGAS